MASEISCRTRLTDSYGCGDAVFSACTRVRLQFLVLLSAFECDLTPVLCSSLSPVHKSPF